MHFSSSLIQKAVKQLKAGGLIALPTETVYGLGADASNVQAVEKIFKVKGRPANHPLIVHIESSKQLKDWAQAVPELTWKLTEAFWPGPLTLVLPAAAKVNRVVTGGLETIALRCPSHPLAQAILQAFGGGIAAPSANRFGQISPTTAEAVRKELGSAVDLILHGGECDLGIESTIIDLSSTAPQILRLGSITASQIETVIKQPLPIGKTTLVQAKAPGMLAHHYAPQTPLHILSIHELTNAVKHAQQNQLPTAVIAYSLPSANYAGIYWLTMPDDASTYAHQLYAKLRQADELGCQQILLERVPPNEEWLAINDRLTRAATKR